MAPPRKTVSRGTNEVENDPERENRTKARAPNPVADDPERENQTQARAQNPVAEAPAAEDPERENRTQARAPRPRAKPLPPEDHEYRTESEYGDEGSGAYRTGANYQPADEEESLAGDLSLEGDGLDALDPEVGSSTKALPALDPRASASASGSDDDDDGADDANATRAGPPIKLEIVAGPDAGKKKRLKGVRMVIGRTPGVDFLLSDQSVSRRHVELIHGDDGVLLRDLGSGNGTKVNGTKVAEKKLEHGDEISIGKTKLRFVDEVAAFKKLRDDAEKKEADKKADSAKKPAEPGPGATTAEEGEGEAADGAQAPAAADGAASAPPGKPTRDRARPVRTSRQAGGDGGFAAKFKALPKPVRLGLVGGLAVLLLIFVMGIALRPPPPAPVDPNKIIAESKMQEARNAAREGDFAKVIALVADAERLLPGIDKTKLSAQAQGELAIEEQLDEARRAMEENRFEDAKKALARAPKGSIKTDEKRAQLRQDLEAAELAYKLEKIDEFIASGEVDAAKGLLIELPMEAQSAPAQKIAEFERELEEQRAIEAQDGARAAANAAAARKARREQEIQEAFVVVERKFGGGEWERAASECARVMDAYATDKDIYARARKLQGLIPSFGRNFDEGFKKFRQGQLAQAAKPLRQAWLAYGQIGLKANKHGVELQEKLGASAVAAGREAALRNDLVTAFLMYKDAARFDPDDSKARAGLDDVANRAEDLFQEGYVVRDREPREAIRKFTIVVKATEPGTSVHERARNQLAAMTP